MQVSCKVIFGVSVALITVFVAGSLMGRLTPLKFANDQLIGSFERARFWGLPSAILLTLFGTVKSKDPEGTNLIKMVVTVCMALIAMFVLIISLFAGMCRWTNRRTLFENTKDPTTKIVLRDLGCGATDSGLPVYAVGKIKTITPWFIWVTSVDTTKVDQKIWRRVGR